MTNGKIKSVSFDHKPTNKEIKAALYNVNYANSKSLYEMSEEYISSKSNILSASTIKGYRTLQRSLGTLGQMDFEQIEQEDIQKFINQYSASHSPKSTHNLHGFISSIFGLYKPQMIIYTTLPKKPKYEPYIPTETEVKKILDYAKTNYPKYYIPLMLGCFGLRRGEICALTDEDIIDNKFLYIHKSMIQDESYSWIVKQCPKSSAGFRKVYVSKEIIDYIKLNGCAYCGCPDNINNRLHDIQKQLCINQFSFHKLRHYYCCMAHNLGIPDIYISQTVGHEHISTTQNIYTHADKTKLVDLQKKVANYFENIE